MPEGKTSEEFDKIINGVRNTRTYNRRVGTRERDAYTTYVNEAFVSGYLDENEAGILRNKVLEAKYTRDLEAVVDELPSYAEMRGTEVIPVKVRKWALGTMIKKSGVLAALLGLLLSLLLVVIPLTVIGNVPHLAGVFPFNLVIALTCVIGGVGSLTCIGRLIYFGMGLLMATSTKFVQTYTYVRENHRRERRKVKGGYESSTSARGREASHSSA